MYNKNIENKSTTNNTKILSIKGRRKKSKRGEMHF